MVQQEHLLTRNSGLRSPNLQVANLPTVRGHCVRIIPLQEQPSCSTTESPKAKSAASVAIKPSLARSHACSPNIHTSAHKKHASELSISSLSVSPEPRSGLDQFWQIQRSYKRESYHPSTSPRPPGGLVRIAAPMGRRKDGPSRRRGVAGYRLGASKRRVAPRMEERPATHAWAGAGILTRMGERFSGMRIEGKEWSGFDQCGCLSAIVLMLAILFGIVRQAMSNDRSGGLTQL